MRKQLLRDLVYLCTSVFSAGIRNIAVQMFYDSYYPDKKETLVSAALFISALCTMFGIMLSSRIIRRSMQGTGRSRFLLTAGMALALCLTFAAMFLVQHSVIYMVLFGISSFCLNFLYNVFDVFISGTVSDADREKNVRILLTYQMIGYIAGPLFFSFFAGSPRLCILLSVSLLLVGYLPVIRAYTAYSGGGSGRMNASAVDAEPSGEVPASVQKADRTAMIYTFLMYCATNTLMPSVAYIMKDHLHVADYAVKSSLFLAGTVLVSAVVIGLFPAMKLWKLRTAAPLAMAAALGMIIVFHSSSPVLLTAAAVLSGIGNGIFLSGSRYYVNFSAAGRGLVGRYNKAMTEATLTGYMMAAVLSFLCIRSGIAVEPVKLFAIILLLAAAGFLACSRFLRSDTGKRHKKSTHP